jgi:hypothetical protein
VDNRRGGCRGDGNEGVALGHGQARQTARGGRKRSDGGQWLSFKGAAGRGAWMGGRRVEVERKREREREGALGAVACRRRGSGPAAARVAA